MMKRTIILAGIMLLCPVICSGATLYDTVKKGNELYTQEKYDDALNAFVDGQIEHPEQPQLKYNIASSKYKMKNYDEALKGYLDVAATGRDARIEEKALFNAGNSLYRQGKLQESIEYYKKALELDPNDKDAQHNLEFVREEIKRRMNEAKNTQQQQQQQQKQEQEQEQQGTGQQQDQARQDRQQNQQAGDNQTQTGQQQDQQTAGQQQGPEQPQPDGQQAATADNERNPQDKNQQPVPADAHAMSKDEAEQWLNSIQENRDNLRQDRQRMKAQKQNRPAKDW